MSTAKNSAPEELLDPVVDEVSVPAEATEETVTEEVPAAVKVAPLASQLLSGEKIVNCW